MDTFDLLKCLTQLCAVSGDESQAAEFISKHIDFAKIRKENGGLCAVLDSEDNDAVRILIDAHIDSIGFRITSITDEGFVCVDKCGGIDARLMPCQKVLIKGKENITGVVCSTPPHLSADDTVAKDIASMYIDTGLPKQELEKYISIGDSVCFDSPVRALAQSRVSGASLDNRAGCCAIIKALEMLKDNDSAVSVTAVFSYQEEIGTIGAKTAAFSQDYDYAICVDVSFAMAKGENPQNCGVMGKGPMIGISPILDKKLSKLAIDIAEKCNIPYQLEVMSGRTSTNADAYSITKSGIRTSLISIPIRYMHTPTEVCDLRDIDNTAAVIFELIKALCN